MRALRYAFDEAIVSLWRGRQSGILSTLTIAVALCVLGGFLIVTTNLERFGSELSAAAEMSVYLQDEVTPAQRTAIEAVLAPGDVIEGRDYFSKPDALRRFKQTFSDLASTIDGLDQNPLPASYEVRLRPTPAARARLDDLGARLRAMPGIADVRYDQQWLSRLVSGINVVRGVGVVLACLLTVAAALTVANVVRLALFARRDEIEIMQLVGAPSVFIRGPFVMEGVLQGGLGALIALVVLAIAFFAVKARYLTPLASAMNVSGVLFLSAPLAVALVAGGMAVGCIGGLVAASGRT
ncbi:MAG TPA: ABC transporter permease [Vicinamibacterales bacterium]|jgi:cell division transport system permease protein|nr:ABC transporter permease [Vicinamibacterales bacterium]